MTPQKKRWLAAFLLLLLLIIAAYLRLRFLGYSSVQGDQSILLHIAMEFVNSGKIPLAANKSSAGIMNPPLIVYLLALPLLIQRSLTAVHLFQAVWGVTAVAVLAGYTKQLFGWRVALLAAGLFAVNPWAVYYSRFIWNPNPIPLFATLLLMSLLAYFAGRRHPVHLALAFLWLAAITQLHLSGLVLIGVVGLVILLFWRPRPQTGWGTAVAPFIVGLGLILLLYWPFIQFEKAVNFADLEAAATALMGDAAPAEAVGVGQARTNAASFLLVQELATGQNVWFVLDISPESLGQKRLFSTLARLLFAASLIYVVASPVLALVQSRKQNDGSSPRWRPRHTALTILAIWLIVPIVAYLRHAVYLQNYYFLYIYPAPFLAAALMLDTFIRKLSRSNIPLTTFKGKRLAIHAVFIGPVLLLGLWQIQVYQIWFQQIEAERIIPPRQAQHVEQAITIARELLEENAGCDLTIVAEGGTVESASLAVMESFVYPTPVRYVDTRRGYIIPANCTLYLTVADFASEAWLVGNGRLLQQIQVGKETWRFYKVVGSDDTLASVAAWQNGLGLVDVHIVGDVVPNSQLTLKYTWHVLSPPQAGAHYHFFNHFLDENGQIVTQDDSPAIDSLYWRVGDRLVTQFYLTLPSELANGRYTLSLGMYTWPDLIRVPLIDSAETTYLVTTMEKNSP